MHNFQVYASRTRNPKHILVIYLLMSVINRFESGYLLSTFHNQKKLNTNVHDNRSTSLQLEFTTMSSPVFTSCRIWQEP
uniref:Uncharacterized protein n=1 Tax=Arundo donax TaxID=35708 RepID=A0A0A9DGT0_ARUDO